MSVMHSVRLLRCSVLTTGCRMTLTAESPFSPSTVAPKFRRLLSYDAAIVALNSLQSNAADLERARKERHVKIPLNVPRARAQLEKSGISMRKLDELPMVHVSGTKGKGSTCAFLESILRCRGLRTGFFSSPHLVTATERIRLDGEPIDQTLFTSHFWRVYDALREESNDNRPPSPYFQFLTVLAFNIFCAERVDVAIIEVGIGGEYDSTNVIRRPRVCGISSLGLDHTSLLGATVEEIAWHKAGIMKQGATAIVAADQPGDSMRVIRERAEEINCKVATAPDLLDYGWGPFPVAELGLVGEAQRKNASLALQLGRQYLDPLQPPGKPFDLTVEEALGLRLCSWPGRTQHVSLANNTELLLDGAHTLESIDGCTRWFRAVSPKLENPDCCSQPSFKVLLFNATSDRRSDGLLESLAKVDFDLAIFCTNFSLLPENSVSDNTNKTVSLAEAKVKCEENEATWRKFSATRSVVFTYLNDALAHLLAGRLNVPVSEMDSPSPVDCDPRRQIQVLVTGSLHLVGGVLELIKPDVCHRTEEEARREERLAAEYRALATGQMPLGNATRELKEAT